MIQGTMKWFRSLTRRDFDNGGILDDIERVIEERDELVTENAALRSECAQCRLALVNIVETARAAWKSPEAT